MLRVVSRNFGNLRVECLEPPPESGLPAIRICSTDFDWQVHSLLSVFVVIGFGGAHLSTVDGAGTIRTLPVGAVHFLEHLTTRLFGMLQTYYCLSLLCLRAR
jgi:hypothetical protein